MVTAGSFPSSKMLGCGAGHSFPTVADVRNGWSYASTTPVCFQGLDRDRFVFVFVSVLLSERSWHLLNFGFSPSIPTPAQIMLNHKMSPGTSAYVPAFVLQSLLDCFHLLFRFACTVVVRHIVSVKFVLTVFRFSY